MLLAMAGWILRVNPNRVALEANLLGEAPPGGTTQARNRMASYLHLGGVRLTAVKRGDATANRCCTPDGP